MAVILGLNAFHGDSSACLVVDGTLRSAVEEERFTRVKHWAGFPSESINFCLKYNNFSIEDVDIVAVNSDPIANLKRKLSWTFSSTAGLKTGVKRLLRRGPAKPSIEEYLDREFQNKKFKGKIVSVEHHLAHLASAHYASSFEESTVLSIDGFGDFVSTAWGRGVGMHIDTADRIFFPHSMGIFYEALTHFLGFKNYGDEYKVMGLAPYGTNSYEKEMDQIVTTDDKGGFTLNLDYFVHQQGLVSHTWYGGVPNSDDCFSPLLEELIGPKRKPGDSLEQRHMDIAFSVQNKYERVFFDLLNNLKARFNDENLSLAGGCGMNSVANGKIFQNTKYKNVYIQSAAGDAGGAIGSAFSAAAQANELKSPEMTHAYWGPDFSNEYHETLISKEATDDFQSAFFSDDELYAETVKAIMDGKVVGWFQGKMEWGARALGNRSILGDPRRDDMKDILNLKIKRRESFRPFAPSILRECVKDWFEENDDVPFMQKVFLIRPNKRHLVPAITHVDGTGRLQTVTESSNWRYYKLIEKFYQKTNVPMLLNTSFNENEPVVCKPEEALATFTRTKMDVLVLGNWFCERN